MIFKMNKNQKCHELYGKNYLNQAREKIKK